jgi:hypothetical protein
MAESFATTNKKRFGFNLSQHKGLFTILFLSLGVLIILLSYYLVQQQQVYKSSASTECAGKTQEECGGLPSCKWSTANNKCTLKNCPDLEQNECITTTHCNWNNNNNTCQVKCSVIENQTNCVKRTYCKWEVGTSKCINKNRPTVIPSPSTTVTTTPNPNNPCLSLDANKGTCEGNNKCVWVGNYYENNKCRLKCSQLRKSDDCNKRVRDCKWERNACINKEKPTNTPTPSTTLTPNRTCSSITSPSACNARAKCKWVDNTCKISCAEYKKQNTCSQRTDCEWQNSGVQPRVTPVTNEYTIEQAPSSTITTIIHQPGSGYAIMALLKKNGNVVTNQQGITYNWNIEDGSIARITPFDGCTNGIQEPCPADHLTIVGLKAGQTNIRVEVFKNNENIASAVYKLIVQ